MVYLHWWKGFGHSAGSGSELPHDPSVCCGPAGSSPLGFQVAPRVLDAIKDMAEQINRITPERIQVELDKLMLGPNPEQGIDLLCGGTRGPYIPKNRP